MNEELSQRKSPVHCPPVASHNRSVIVFLTVCTAQRKPFLACEDVHQLLLASWQVANNWVVGRYVLMPDHVHLFCAPASLQPLPLAKWVQFWKSHTSNRWPRPEERPVWQKSFWDTQLRRDDSYGTKWEYVRQNPVRRALVAKAEDWPYQGELNILEWHD
jgi:REP element-mobilizing transposase RayT